jgi:hypothetical protein
MVAVAARLFLPMVILLTKGAVTRDAAHPRLVEAPASPRSKWSAVA